MGFSHPMYAFVSYDLDAFVSFLTCCYKRECMYVHMCICRVLPETFVNVIRRKFKCLLSLALK